MNTHAAIWIDHREARVFHIKWNDANEWTAHARERHLHLHHKAGLGDSGRQPLDKPYLDSVATSVADADEVLVVGPGSAKNEFMAHLRLHQPQLAKKVVAVEAMDHPTDPEIIRYARKHFRAVDQLRGTSPLR